MTNSYIINIHQLSSLIVLNRRFKDNWFFMIIQCIQIYVMERQDVKYYNNKKMFTYFNSTLHWIFAVNSKNTWILVKLLNKLLDVFFFVLRIYKYYATEGIRDCTFIIYVRFFSLLFNFLFKKNLFSNRFLFFFGHGRIFSSFVVNFNKSFNYIYLHHQFPFWLYQQLYKLLLYLIYQLCIHDIFHPLIGSSS